MFGCFRRLGCLAVLVIAAALYVTRDAWRPFIPQLNGQSRVANAANSSVTWQRIDEPSAARGERAVRALAARRGPVYVNVAPGELASYAFLSLADALPPSLRDAQTSVQGDRIHLRSVVNPADFAGILAAPVRSVLHQRDTLQLSGTVEVLRPGLAQFRVQTVQIGSVPVPTALIPRVVSRFRQGAAPAAVSADAIPLPLPDYIGDIRVGRGHITLYKSTP